MSFSGHRDGSPEPLLRLTAWPATGVKFAVWAMGLALLLLVPAIRAVEFNEGGMAKECVEEFTQTARVRFEKRHVHLVQGIDVVSPIPALAPFNYRRPTHSFTQHGHRLANGLIAPFRC